MPLAPDPELNRVRLPGAGMNHESTDETLVIACDDDVRARLKFLMWVRGMAGATPGSEPAWKLTGVRA